MVVVLRVLLSNNGGSASFPLMLLLLFSTWLLKNPTDVDTCSGRVRRRSMVG